jgi:hypothetical protein
MRTSVVLTAMLLAGSAVAQAPQIPLPSFGNTFTSSLTRGFWFQAPVNMVISGLEVPNEASQPNQVVEVIDLGAAPPAYPGTITGNQLFYDNATPAGQVIPCTIAIQQGQYIGILGACNDIQGSANSYNSYGTPAGPFTGTIFGQPITLTRFLTQSGIASNGGNQPCSEESGGPLGRVNVYVNAPNGFASAIPFGDGCGQEFTSFYENQSTFDLSNTSLSMNFTGNGYVAIAGNTSIAPQPSTPVAMGDDAVLQFSLGFPMPIPGGITNDVWVSSNGFVHLGTNTASGCCSFNPSLFFNGGSPCIAAKWRDLNPSAGGTVQFDTDPVAGAAYVTFTGVPDYGSTNSNDFQYVFNVSGIIEVRWGNCAPTAGGVGYSGGINALTPPQTDISANPVIITGTADRYALTHTAQRPVLGTSVALDTTSVPAGSAAGITLLGLFEYSPPIDLTPLGIPGCSQYISADFLQFWFPSSGTGSSSITIPNNPSLASVLIHSQGAAFVPTSINPGGVLTANGVRLTVDVN